jgi:flagellar protein FliS
MSYAAASSAYRDMEVLSASPGRLVVIVYDFLLVNLRRASIAIETGNVELRAISIGKAQDAIAELMGELDMDRGGAIARELAALYGFFLNSLIDVSQTNDRRLLGRITTQVTELRDAFAQISTLTAASAA